VSFTLAPFCPQPLSPASPPATTWPFPYHLARPPATSPGIAALDSSCLPTGLLLVQVALIYRGRAIPLSWSVIAQAGATVGYQVYEPLLLAACALLADFSQIELTADRGFFHQQLLRFCVKHHWHFRLRAPRDTIVVAADQRVASLVQWCPPRGAVSFIHRVEVFGARLGPVHLALANPAWTAREDPWSLISDGSLILRVKWSSQDTIYRGS
jgi:hypothetical protein